MLNKSYFLSLSFQNNIMRLFYREFGDKQKTPLVILHGLFGISDNWVSFGRKMSENYHVLIPDQRNHGQSQHCPLFDYPLLTEDLYEFINEHNLDDPIILGHSMGGKVAMNFALNYPLLSKALIVADMSPRAYKANRHHQTFIRAMRSVDFSKIRYRREIEDILSKTISSVRIRQFLLKNIYRDEQKKLGWRINLDSIGANLPKIFEAIEKQDTQYSNPALFIRGAQSEYVPEEDFPLIRRNFVHAQIKTIENAGHWLHAEQAGEFLGICRDFLNSVSS